MLIFLFKNVLKISNFEKSAKTSKNLKKPQKTAKKPFLCVCAFTWEEKISLIKKGLFYANFFEFEVKSYAPFFGQHLASAYCAAEEIRENTGAKKIGKILQKKVKPIVGVGSPESCVRSNLTRLKGG